MNSDKESSIPANKIEIFNCTFCYKFAIIDTSKNAFKMTQLKFTNRVVFSL